MVEITTKISACSECSKINLPTTLRYKFHVINFHLFPYLNHFHNHGTEQVREEIQRGNLLELC